MGRYSTAIFRLTECNCGSDHAAYVQTQDGKWRVRCFDCGRTSPEGSDTRHGAQLLWNGRNAG